MLFVCINKASEWYGHILSFDSLQGDDVLVVTTLWKKFSLNFGPKELVPYDGAINIGDILSCNPSKEGEYTQSFKHFADKTPQMCMLGGGKISYTYTSGAFAGASGVSSGIKQYITKGWIVPTELCEDSVNKQIKLLKDWVPKVGDEVLPFNNKVYGWASYPKGGVSAVTYVGMGMLQLKDKHGWDVKTSCVFPVWTKEQGTKPIPKIPTVNLSVGDTVRIKEGSEVYREGDYLNPIGVDGEVVSVKPKQKWPIVVSFGGIKNSYKESHLEKV